MILGMVCLDYLEEMLIKGARALKQTMRRALFV